MTATTPTKRTNSNFTEGQKLVNKIYQIDLITANWQRISNKNNNNYEHKLMAYDLVNMITLYSKHVVELINHSFYGKIEPKPHYQIVTPGKSCNYSAEIKEAQEEWTIKIMRQPEQLNFTSFGIKAKNNSSKHNIYQITFNTITYN